MKALFVRYSWFVVVGAIFFQRDMCLGGGHPPPDPKPVDSGTEHDSKLDPSLQGPAGAHLDQLPG